MGVYDGADGAAAAEPWMHPVSPAKAVELLHDIIDELDGFAATQAGRQGVLSEVEHLRVALLRTIEHLDGQSAPDPERLGHAVMHLWSGVRTRLDEIEEDGVTAEDRLAELTERERQVLRLLAKGLANKQIAQELGISAPTVRNHLSTVYRKLGVQERTQATLFALRAGLIEL